MLDDFVVRAFLAGAALALAAAPLGCFIVWRRMAYFGDAIAHASLLGVAISLAFSMSTFFGVVLVTVMLAYFLGILSGKLYAMDTLLGVASHVSLALGLVAVSKISGVRLDLAAYLFGDILTVTRTDIAIIAAGAALVIALLVWRWVPLLTTTLSPDMATARGFDARKEQMVLLVTLALLVAVAIKIVGALLITSVLIIPAAAARPLSRTPEQMAVVAAIAGLVSVALGLALSVYSDTPTGPSIVVVAGLLFLLANVVSSFVEQRRRQQNRSLPKDA